MYIIRMMLTFIPWIEMADEEENVLDNWEDAHTEVGTVNQILFL